MRIDSHQHFWHFDAVRDAGPDGWITEEMRVLRRDFLPRDLEPELHANGIDACIAVQAGQSEDETHFLLDLAERNPFIAGVVGWVDFRADDLARRLEYFSQFEKLRGFRHIVQAETDDRFLLRPNFCRGIAQLREYNFTYDILIYARQLPAAVEFAGRFPEQPLVVDHIAKPAITAGEIHTWERNLRALAAHANVFCKLSGLITEADWRRWTPGELQPYLEIAYHAFGPDRLMFGSDWPVCLLAGSYSKVKALVADFLQDRPANEQADERDEEQEKIFGGNAKQFYSLKVLHGFTTQR